MVLPATLKSASGGAEAGEIDAEVGVVARRGHARADERVGLTSIPYWLMHVVALGVCFVPFSWGLVGLCVGLYYLRMFGITAGYHRYFAHRGYKTGRVFQFVLAWLGTMSSQKGVLWWSGHHRHHHRYSDMEEDIHSPKRGFWWSHQTWFLVPRFDRTAEAQLREFRSYPELAFLDRHWWIGPTSLGVATLVIGGLPAFLWGFVLSTVLLWHGTFTINSLAHVWGSRRYPTTDTSRNNFFLALITMGEGWHNNHHHYQSTANNGFFWWEIDLSYNITAGLNTVVSYGRRTAKQADGLVPFGQPDETFSALARYQVPSGPLKGASALWSYTWWGDSTLSTRTNWKMPPGDVHNLVLGYRWKKYSLGLRVENILDQLSLRPSVNETAVGVMNHRNYRFAVSRTW